MSGHAHPRPGAVGRGPRRGQRARRLAARPSRPGTGPGPDVLYAPAGARRRSSRTAAPWRAEPILVSGATRLPRRRVPLPGLPLRRPRRRGRAGPDGPVQRRSSSCSRRSTARSRTRPTPRSPNNAADLVELRVRPLDGATAFRVTLNTLADPARTAFTIALGSSAAAACRGRTAPASARRPSCSSPCTGRRPSSSTRRPARRARRRPTATVDARRRQFDVRVPHGGVEPGHGDGPHGRGRRAVGPGGRRLPRAEPRPGVGDRAGRRRAVAAPRSSTSRSAPSEPLPKISRAGRREHDRRGRRGREGRRRVVARARAGRRAGRRRRRAVLRRRRLRQARRAARDDESRRPAQRAPQPHPRQPLRPRRRASTTSASASSPTTGGTRRPRPCTGRFLGRLQPYAVYVPRKAPARARATGSRCSCTGCRRTTTSSSAAATPTQFGDRGDGLDRGVAARPRARRLVQGLRGGRRLRDVGRRRAPLPARPDVGGGERLLDGRRRGRTASRPLARPVRARVPDRRAAVRRRRLRARRCATSR